MLNSIPTLKKTSIFIVDDHPLVRDWLSRLIQEEADLQVSGWADNAEEAIRAIEQHSPEIIIVDIGLRGKSGLELIRFLTDQNPETKILVLSMHDEAVYAGRSFKAGARGYVSKREATESVVIAVRRILAGGVYVSPAFAENFALGLTRNKQPSLANDVGLLAEEYDTGARRLV